MNKGTIRRKIETIENQTGIDSSDLEPVSVCEALSYEMEAVDDTIVRIRKTGEYRRYDGWIQEVLEK